MKVCAHMNLGPFQNDHERFGSVAAALDFFRDSLQDMGIDKGDGDHYVIDLYPECSECSYGMNFHDYPMARYELGPRGGLSKVIV
jgi:hypothetical protein